MTTIEHARNLEVSQVLADLQSHYSIGKVIHLTRMSNAGQNDAYKVESDKGVFFLRKYRKRIDQRTAVNETQLLQFLRQNGLPVAGLTLNVRGEVLTQTEHGDRFFLQEFFEASFFPSQGIELNSEQIGASAEVLADYHRRAVNFPLLAAPANIDNFTVSRFFSKEKALTLWKMAMEQAAHNDDPVSQTVLDITPIKIDQIMGLDETAIDQQVRELPSLLAHGDFTPQNLIFQEDRVVAITDWELARYQPRVWEVTRALCAFCRSDISDFFNTPIDLERARGFLLRYLQVNTLSDAELRAIPFFAYLGSLLPEYILTSKYLHSRNVDHFFPKEARYWNWWKDSGAQLTDFFLTQDL